MKTKLLIIILLVISFFTAGVLAANSLTPTVVPTEIYGSKNAPIKIRITNGGAGPTGILRALAEDYLKYSQQKIAIAWSMNISPNSLKLLHAGKMDMAIIYEPQPALQAVTAGWGTHLTLIFYDHFLLVGPKNNPANVKSTDTPAIAFSKIAALGNVTSYLPNGLFLSRNDLSSTNAKERYIWQLANLAPWTQNSAWYKKISIFPKDALLYVDQNSLYTIVDQGTWLSNKKYLKNTVIYIQGGELLQNPAFVLLSQHPSPLAIDFLNYLRSPRAQHLIANYGKDSNLGTALFSPAYPVKNSQLLQQEQ